MSEILDKTSEMIEKTSDITEYLKNIGFNLYEDTYPAGRKGDIIIDISYSFEYNCYSVRIKKPNDDDVTVSFDNYKEILRNQEQVIQFLKEKKKENEI